MTTFDDVLTWSGTSLYDAGDALKAVANKYEDVYEELTGLSTDGLEGKTAEAEAKARRILADDAMDLWTALGHSGNDLIDASTTVDSLMNQAGPGGGAGTDHHERHRRGLGVRSSSKGRQGCPRKSPPASPLLPGGGRSPDGAGRGHGGAPAGRLRRHRRPGRHGPRTADRGPRADVVNAGKQEPDPSWTPDEVNDWWTVLSPEYAALLQRQKDIHALSAMFNEKSTTATGRSLLVLDNSGDHLRAAVGSGDVDSAAHVLVYTPGMTTTVAGGLVKDDGQPGGSVDSTENIMEKVDPNWVDSDSRCSETVAGVLLVVAFAYATIYGCGTFLIEGIDPNTKPERFTGPRSDIPITQARADTLNLFLTIYDTLTRDHIVDAWVPPAPGPGGGGYQARIGGEYDQPVCPEGTTNEIYALAEATETTLGSLHSEHAVILIGQAATSHGFTKDAGYGDYRRLTDGAQIDFSNSQAVRITTGCHKGATLGGWPSGTEAVPDYLRTTGRAPQAGGNGSWDD